jgi:uncharacterized protein
VTGFQEREVKNMFDDMKWYNEPLKCTTEGSSLSVVTKKNTDFWRNTFYGFTRDSGHFLYRPVKGDVTAAVTFIGRYEELYDQAGLMIRADEKNWIKTGIEFTDSKIHVSAVVTRDFSDWSVLPLPDYSGKLSIRLTRYGTAVRIHYLDHNDKWRLLRLAYLDMQEECQVGVMCCSPSREGFCVEFSDFSLSDPISKELCGD